VSLLAAVDIGGTKTLAEVFDGESNGRGVAFPTPRKADLLRPLCDVLDDLADGGAISAVAIGCPGPLDRTQGIVLNPPNLARGWWGLHVADRLQERFHCAVALENDANLGALGEACLGGGQGFSSVLYLTVSTGVGGGIVVDRKIFRGSRGFAGELGHTTVASKDAPLCGCGRKGCLEAVASGSAIARSARERGWSKDSETITARAVAVAAERGDHVAIAVLREAATYLAQGIVNFVYAFDPSVVLIGGGVAKSKLFFEFVQRSLAKEPTMAPIRGVPVRVAELGDRSVISGAKVLASYIERAKRGVQTPPGARHR
jgi:glucokinase